MITSFKDLEVYQEAYKLAVIINRRVKQFPLYEKDDLAFQLRKASKSIPANIAEGWAKRRFPKEFLHHLDIALGSCNEMEVHIGLARDLGYWPKAFADEALKRYVQVGGKLANLRSNWKTY